MLQLFSQKINVGSVLFQFIERRLFIAVHLWLSLNGIIGGGRVVVSVGLRWSRCFVFLWFVSVVFSCAWILSFLVTQLTFAIYISIHTNKNELHVIPSHLSKKSWCFLNTCILYLLHHIWHCPIIIEQSLKISKG